MIETALPAGVTGLAWTNAGPMVALGDGQAGMIGGTLQPVHDGAILAAALLPDGQGLLTGGDDGTLRSVRIDGTAATLGEFGSKWVEHVVASPASGLIACAAGRNVAVFKPGATEPSHTFAHPSTVAGLAVDERGRRLAVSLYGGARLYHALAADSPGVEYKWPGSHLATTLSPDADFIVTAQQDLGLHGWRVKDKKDLRMSGYPGKTRSYSWDRRGRWLATSGAEMAVVWPFLGKEGPMGKAPLLVAERASRVTAVAFHPKEERLAIGYADGAVLSASLEGPPVTDVRGPTGAAVTAFAWSPDGAALAGGDAGGAAFVWSAGQ